jgi:hypothetical protein
MGFLLARPLTAAELEERFLRNAAAASTEAQSGAPALPG